MDAFNATMCATPSPRFQATLSDNESTMLSPTSIDKAHTGRAFLSTNSDAILNARMHDFNTRTTCTLLGRAGANHPRQRVQMDDRAGRAFSPDLAGCVAVAGSWGSLGDEGGDVVVVGPRSAGISDEVEAASDDARAVLGARASDMLDFGVMGLNLPRCNAARTFSQDGRAVGEAFKRLSSSTRYERGSLRDVNRVSSRGVLLNPGYNDTSRSSRSMSVPFSSSSFWDVISEP